ncbi:MAG: hypothetical protein ACXV5Q_00585 [Frankiaceae bacterium]
MARQDDLAELERLAASLGADRLAVLLQEAVALRDEQDRTTSYPA